MVLGAEDWKIGFIGGGNMAGAIIGGVTSCGKISPHRIFVYDRHSEKLDSLKQKYGVNSAESDVDVAKICDIIFLAVKPQNFTDLLRSLKHTVTEKKVFVSIAAGISSEFIAKSLSCRCPVVRAMPNTPLLLGKGATAVSKTENVPRDVFVFIRSLFECCGTVSVIDESQMDAIVSVGGSSPAYVYLFVKSVIDSAVGQGIDSGTAFDIICQTICGSVEMLKKSGRTPEELIKMVSTKGGTTAAAVDVFKKEHFEDIIDDAMKACTARTKELGL
ncbi:MAG TPA: pyrroline-5-carboxylate reductase [Ruminococcaceae bacterium]|jgi:pyrroline-5-carboxylate reductase|nr:pyrroline-5-carboxylate reductase [Oscillospiraceae bacterium]